MRAVNLVPRDDSRANRRQPGAVMLTGVLGSVVVVALLAGAFLMTSSTVAERQAEVDGLRAELAAIPPPEPAPAGQTTLEAEKSQRVTVLGKALGSRVAWDRVLREISLVLPEDIWLESLNANAPDPNAAPATPGAPASGTGSFTITGYSYSHDGVARLLARLSVLPQLERPKLGSSVLDESKREGIVKFTISAALRGASA
jgi:Tfp pilus assembly protein PilN